MQMILSINTIDDYIQLQRDLLELEKWSKLWQMEFNPLKYIGVVIDSKLTWKEHVKQVRLKPMEILHFCVVT